MNSQLIEKKIEKLPENLQQEALDFIEFLILKNSKVSKKKKISFSWEGGLSNLKKCNTSVDLQHKSMEWR